MHFTKKSKALPVILLMATMMFALCSCEEPEQGKINEVKIEENKSAVQTIPSDFNKLSDEPGYRYKYHDIGRAHISIPYPEKWTVSKETDYDVTFTAPDTDRFFPGCQIKFHSSLEQNYDTSDIHDVMKDYEGIINNYQYPYNGMKIKVIPSSTTDIRQVNTKISDPNNHDLISYRDLDADVLNTSGKIPNDALYHHVTAFYWKDYSCILSSLCSMDKNEAMNELILYMVSNSEYIEDSLGTTTIYTLFEDSHKIKVPISEYYVGREIAGNKYINSGYTFACPADSGTAYSHSFLTFLEIEGEKTKLTEEEFVKKYLDTILKANFGITSKSENIYGYMTSEGSINLNSQTVPEHIYKFDFSPGTKAQNVQVNQAWEIIIYPVKNNGVTDFIILTTPEMSLISTFDTIKLIIKYGSF